MDIGRAFAPQAVLVGTFYPVRGIIPTERSLGNAYMNNLCT